MYARVEGETFFFLCQPTGIRIHLHHVNKTCQQLHHAYTNSSAIDNSKSIWILYSNRRDESKDRLDQVCTKWLVQNGLQNANRLLVLNRKLVSSVHITRGPNSQVAFTLYIHSKEIAVETRKQPLKVTVLLIPAKPKKTPQKWIAVITSWVFTQRLSDHLLHFDQQWWDATSPHWCHQLWTVPCMWYQHKLLNKPLYKHLHPEFLSCFWRRAED